MSQHVNGDGLPDPTGPDLEPLDADENSVAAAWNRFSELLYPSDDFIDDVPVSKGPEMRCTSCGEIRSVDFFPHPKKSPICGRCITAGKPKSAKEVAQEQAALDKKILATIRSPRLDLDIKMPLLGEVTKFRRWDLCDTGFIDRGHYVLVHPHGKAALVLCPAPSHGERVDRHEFPASTTAVAWPFGLGRTLQALGFGPILQSGTLAHANSYLPNDAFRYFVLGKIKS